MAPGTRFLNCTCGSCVVGMPAKALQGIPSTHEPHVQFKQRVPGAIGLIRTGDTVQYANMVLVSG